MGGQGDVEQKMDYCTWAKGNFRDAIDVLDVACGVPQKGEIMKVLGELIDDERKKRQVMFGPENMMWVLPDYD